MTSFAAVCLHVRIGLVEGCVTEIRRAEKVAIYAGGAFVIAIIVWVMVAFMRAEGMLDRNLAIGAAAVWNLMRLRSRKQKPWSVSVAKAL